MTTKEQRSRINWLTFQITQKSKIPFFFSPNLERAHRTRLQNEQSASSVLCICHYSEGQYVTQLSLESNISVNNCWRWLVADTDAFVQEPLRTLDEHADCSPKAPRQHSLQRNSGMWRQINPIGKSKLLKVWNNLNPPPLSPAPPLPAECRWRKCAGKCCARTTERMQRLFPF